MSRPLRLAAALLSLGCLLAASPAAAKNAPAQNAPACGGRDMRPVVAETEPRIDALLKARMAEMPFARGTLFRLTRPGVPPSHVLGTIHIVDSPQVELSRSALDAFGSARVLALELEEIGSFTDPDKIVAMLPKLLPMVVAKPRESLAALLPPAALPPIEEALKAHHLPAAFARTFKPSFVTSVLGLPACLTAAGAPAKGIDLWLAAEAKARGLPLVGLETLDEQLHAMLMQPPEVERALAAGLSQNLATLDDMFTTLQRVYADGDIGWIIAVSELQSTWSSGPAAMPASYRQSMLVRRNVVMHERARALVDQGGALIAVGAAHLPGEDGLLRLFEKDGFVVERVD